MYSPISSLVLRVELFFNMCMHAKPRTVKSAFLQTYGL